MIYSWEAGLVCGVGYSLAEAQALAEPYVSAETPGLVEEAQVAMVPSGCGKVPVMERTGRSWRGLPSPRGTMWEKAAGA